MKLKAYRAGFVAVIGRPNAGKSTLLNALVGQKLSSVSPKVQTTRRRILGILTERDFQMIIQDTPGLIMKQRNSVEQRMMATVKTAVRDADLILVIVDASERPKDVLSMIQPRETSDQPTVGIILNKVDLIPLYERNSLMAHFQRTFQHTAIFECSALMKLGLNEIKSWASSRLPLSPILYPKEMVGDQSERSFVSDLVHEKIFELYGQEVPYSCHVNVVDYKERLRPHKDLICVEISVAKDGQKGILVGRAGTMIRKLSILSRKSIEDFLGRPIFLDIHVNVEKILENGR
jgi:GTP-binding protein Era